MEKTLLIRGIGIFLSISLVVLLGGCSFVGEIEKMQEQIRLEEEAKEEEIQREELYEQIEEIGLEYYLGENTTFVQEFETFLEKKSISKERILEYLKRWDKYNNYTIYKEYLMKKEQLEEELNKNLISTKEFEIKSELLENEYSESKNRLINYFTNEERKIFESSKGEIEELYNLIYN